MVPPKKSTFYASLLPVKFGNIFTRLYNIYNHIFTLTAKINSIMTPQPETKM